MAILFPLLSEQKKIVVAQDQVTLSPTGSWDPCKPCCLVLPSPVSTRHWFWVVDAKHGQKYRLASPMAYSQVKARYPIILFIVLTQMTLTMT